MSARRKYWLKGNPNSSQNGLFVEALDSALWSQGEKTDWDAVWHTEMPPPDILTAAPAHSWINHIPGNNHLTVKSALHQTVNAACQRWERSERFLPETHNLPAQLGLLEQAAQKAPEQAWILKPANGARGEDIALLDTLDDLPTQGEWVVQRYIDRPHLYAGRKYVLRLYVLISAIDPLTIWRFAEGSVKLASMPYSSEERNNPYVFLTNPDVNERNTAVGVEFLPLAHYWQWLQRQGHDPASLRKRIDALIVDTVMAGCDAMRLRSRVIEQQSAQAYELLGFDCLIDEQLKPWLLECNLSPSLDVCAQPAQGGTIEAAMKKALIADLVQLLGLNEAIPRSICSVTRQAGELARRGRYECLYPAADAVARFRQFVAPSLADQQAVKAATGVCPQPKFVPWKVTEQFESDKLFLISSETGQVFAPNDTASWIWLQLCAGEAPEAMAEALADQADLARVRQEIWSTLGDWSRQGLVRQLMTI